MRTKHELTAQIIELRKRIDREIIEGCEEMSPQLAKDTGDFLNSLAPYELINAFREGEESTWLDMGKVVSLLGKNMATSYYIMQMTTAITLANMGTVIRDESLFSKTIFQMLEDEEIDLPPLPPRKRVSLRHDDLGEKNA